MKSDFSLSSQVRRRTAQAVVSASLLGVATMSNMCGPEEDAAQLSCLQVDQAIQQLGDTFRHLYRHREPQPGQGGLQGDAQTFPPDRRILTRARQAIPDSAWTEWTTHINWHLACGGELPTHQRNLILLADATEQFQTDLAQRTDPATTAIRVMTQGMTTHATNEARSIVGLIRAACDRVRGGTIQSDGAELFRRIYQLQSQLIAARDQIFERAQSGEYQLPTCGVGSPATPQALRERIRVIAADRSSEPDQDVIPDPIDGERAVRDVPMGSSAPNR